MKEENQNEQPTPVKGDAEKGLITAFVPCYENDERMVGGFTSTDGTSLCHVREIKIIEP